MDGSTQAPNVCVIELGGTLGDIESMPFVEALRQLQDKVRVGWVVKGGGGGAKSDIRPTCSFFVGGRVFHLFIYLFSIRTFFRFFHCCVKTPKTPNTPRCV